EGADALAATTLEAVAGGPEFEPHLRAEFAAVVPFGLDDYRASRPAWFHAEFDRLAARCTYILQLEDISDASDVDTPLAEQRWERAYRGQSAVLLRQCDLLVAAAGPDQPGKAGGTLETVQAAVIAQLPVVFVHTASGQVFLLEPGQDLRAVLAGDVEQPADWR